MSVRSSSFGEGRKLTFADRLGIWLSNRKILKLMKKHQVRVVVDAGAGFDASLSRASRDLVSRSIVVDVALNTELIESGHYETYIGALPHVAAQMPQDCADLVILNSVLEHLDFPEESLAGLRLLLKDGGLIFVNVPTWFGKVILEFLAFRLSLSPREEMEDHRRYYSKRELWMALRSSGFTPSKIRVRRHKFFTNVYAIAHR